MESIRIEIGDLIDLDMVSQEFNIPQKELIDFHNQHCALHEILPDHLPKYIKYLYIPADKKSLWKDNHLLHSRIDLPDTPADLTYGVLIKDSSSGIQMHYLIDIQRENKEVVFVVRKKLYVNDQEVELMVEKLIETAGEALYPLKISLKKDGRTEEILNGNEIRNRWKKEYLPKIQQYYTGEAGDEIIEKLSQFYKNMSRSTKELYDNLFYAVYFIPLYTSYPEYQKEEMVNFYFPSLKETVSYAAVFSLQKILTVHNKILIHVKGEQNAILGAGLKKGCLDLVYQLDKETKNISSIVGKLSVFHQKGEIDVFIEIYQ